MYTHAPIGKQKKKSTELGSSLQMLESINRTRKIEKYAFDVVVYYMILHYIIHMINSPPAGISIHIGYFILADD